ncbi:MAG: hypothetical protein LC772_12650, partial [Chloroflexi bacterium]|nr:hypothetical protein [Chloroflexota bacterium]
MSQTQEKHRVHILPARDSTDSDDYIRLGDIFELHRGHIPAAGFKTYSESRGPYDCRIVTQGETQQFRIDGQERWANYQEILDAFDAQRQDGAGGHTSPDPPEIVFAPLKIVLAERDEPL